MTTTRRTAASLALLLASVGALGACSDGSAAAADGNASTAPSPILPGATIQVTASDGTFDGLPDTVPAGVYDLEFANTGDDEHELVLFRNTSDLSVAELAARGPGAASLVDVAGITWAGPGRRAAHATPVELVPGVYTVACFVPTDDGRPHALHGMHTTVTVV